MSELGDDYLHKILGNEYLIIQKVIKAQKCSGVIYVPTKLIGKKVTIIIKE